MAATEAGTNLTTDSAADGLFWLLVDTARTLAARYPQDTGAFVRLAKLTEETGEVAAQINIWAGTGLKREEHGEFDPRELAAELSDVLRSAVSIALALDILDLLIAEIRGRHTEIAAATSQAYDTVRQRGSATAAAQQPADEPQRLRSRTGSRGGKNFPFLPAAAQRPAAPYRHAQIAHSN
ncbi:hypothetical protein KIF24_18175 [Micromonospora sp. Llam7]|uniref:hypothetical protein n=1 Tax=Micromonospora tarapacensis TaxID=2835305 RepID=UPI001C82A98C|nr:hypothetical protein [Micromonospora tarapacensis]MBX7267776.1 hypothetical protein [Micromonospora tarapacensis]